MRKQLTFGRVMLFALVLQLCMLLLLLLPARPADDNVLILNQMEARYGQ
jgi:hypothetical protein